MPGMGANCRPMSRICLSVLGRAAEPLTTRDIAVQLQLERALDKSDERLLRLMTRRVGVALRIQLKTIPYASRRRVVHVVGISK